MNHNLTFEETELLKQTIQGKWEYIDGVVNVDGSVWFGNSLLTKIPFKFGYVTKNFDISCNKLTSLKNSPSWVKGNFVCYNNQLTSLQYCTQEINGDFDFHKNKITDLKHFPSRVDGKISIGTNSLKLNNELFEMFARLNGEERITHFNYLSDELRQQIPIQFGITDQNVMDDIWASYLMIYHNWKKNNTVSFTSLAPASIF